MTAAAAEAAPPYVEPGQALRARIFALLAQHGQLAATMIIAALPDFKQGEIRAELARAQLAGHVVVARPKGARVDLYALAPTPEQREAASCEQAQREADAATEEAVRQAAQADLDAGLAERTAPGWTPTHEPTPAPAGSAVERSIRLAEIDDEHNAVGAITDKVWTSIVTGLATQPDLVTAPAGPAWIKPGHNLAPATPDELRGRTITTCVERLSKNFLSALISRFRSNKTWAPISPVNMVADGPFFDAVRDLVTKPGYYRECGVILRPYVGAEDLTEEALLARLAEHGGDPLALARACAKQLLTTVGTIPTDDAGRAAWVAHILTLLTRDLFPCAPMFVYDATRPGSGKSITARAAFIIGSHCRFTELPFSMATSAELAKSLGAEFARANGGAAVPRGILVDNASLNEFRDPVLENWLTAPTISGRELGFSRNFSVPNRLTLAITCNGGSLGPDLNRRGVVIRLEPTSDNPATLTFEQPPPDVFARMFRTDLTMAAIALLWAYRRAGCPEVNAVPLNSFEGWWRAAGAPAMWATGSNPLVATHNRIVADDPDLERRALWIALVSALGGGPLTMAEILRTGSRRHREALEAALDALPLKADNRRASAYGLPSAAIVGKTVGRFSNAWIRTDGGLKQLRTARGHNNTTTYAVEVKS